MTRQKLDEVIRPEEARSKVIRVLKLFKDKPKRPHSRGLVASSPLWYTSPGI